MDYYTSEGVIPLNLVKENILVNITCLLCHYHQLWSHMCDLNNIGRWDLHLIRVRCSFDWNFNLCIECFVLATQNNKINYINNINLVSCLLSSNETLPSMPSAQWAARIKYSINSIVCCFSLFLSFTHIHTPSHSKPHPPNGENEDPPLSINHKNMIKDYCFLSIGHNASLELT